MALETGRPCPWCIPELIEAWELGYNIRVEMEMVGRPDVLH
jgi:hypothetical protein